jgi:aromatic ring-opening dioxygenase LigB subunit
MVDSPDERPAALLVLADGSARRGQRSPGTFHPAAEEADAGVARALATADLDALLKLDPATCAELWLGGRVPLQVLAGAMTGTVTDTGTDAPRPLTGRVLYEAAPFGVGYVVATCLAQAEP